ncbi:endoplasmic reticulum oxidoreductin [Nitzschia inconspicua]|uniref:Endoplasmic reticulum oxidoreductin n=1 Tax=Nitzschia inconspicua TaxID=303405 RepID=A0A9K3LLD5_9STRA|nr:endoplasmic reticulum oxidoreductin [Nitzschia inconspicua]
MAKVTSRFPTFILLSLGLFLWAPVAMRTNSLLFIGGCSAFSFSSFSSSQHLKQLPFSWTRLDTVGTGTTTASSSRIPSTTRLFSSSSSSSSVISSNPDLLPGIELIDQYNAQIQDQVDQIRQASYFRLFCVDILASCEYMPQELFECYSETCEVYPVDDDDVPSVLRTTDYQEKDFEMDGWARWDMPSNDYYDTEEFPEGYTGYDGSEIWKFIHEKICFDIQQQPQQQEQWKADFNKAVSGVHAVISAQVARGIQDKVEAGEEFTAEEVWRDPKIEFDRRLGPNGETPMAMENLYFAYMLFLSAIAKAQPKLLADCQSGKMDGAQTEMLQTFLSLPLFNDPAIQGVSKQLRHHALASPDNLWEVRMRSRDLLRIMNCVQCNKCRLHGKVAMMGLSTALQIHLGTDGNGGDPNRLNRVELATLVSTLYKLSSAVDFCQKMRSS